MTRSPSLVQPEGEFFPVQCGPTTITSGQTVTIRAFLYGAVSLRGYQKAIDVSPGASGTLTLTSLNFETVRSDWVFGGYDALVPTNLAAGRLAGALYESGVEVGESTLYLGTLTFVSSSNAVGTFTVNARVSDTKLMDSADQPLEWQSIPKNVVVTPP